MKLLSINTVAINTNAPADIMYKISAAASVGGYKSMICYGRRGVSPFQISHNQQDIRFYKFNTNIDVYAHALYSRLGDSEGLHSRRATIRLINHICEFNPQIIHLHNIHGHYLHYPLLFDFLKRCKIPIVWTLHDCWAYTGHCAYYSYSQCNAWKSDCKKCGYKRDYPQSYFISNSKKNLKLKKEYFSGVPNMHIVAVSDWLKNEIEESFLSDYPIHRIYNGVDTDVFTRVPTYQIDSREEKIILGVASQWDRRKGLDDFYALSSLLPNDYKIHIVGYVPKTLIRNTDNIIFLGKLSKNELVEQYSKASIYVNASKEETFGMTTIEALSCETPVIVNSLTALPEVAGVYNNSNVCIIDTADSNCLMNEIKRIVDRKINLSEREKLRQITDEKFSSTIMVQEYLNLYASLI